MILQGVKVQWNLDDDNSRWYISFSHPNLTPTKTMHVHMSDTTVFWSQIERYKLWISFRNFWGSTAASVKKKEKVLKHFGRIADHITSNKNILLAEKPWSKQSITTPFRNAARSWNDESAAPQPGRWCPRPKMTQCAPPPARLAKHEPGKAWSERAGGENVHTGSQVLVATVTIITRLHVFIVLNRNWHVDKPTQLPR